MRLYIIVKPVAALAVLVFLSACVAHVPPAANPPSLLSKLFAKAPLSPNDEQRLREVAPEVLFKAVEAHLEVVREQVAVAGHRDIAETASIQLKVEDTVVDPGVPIAVDILQAVERITTGQARHLAARQRLLTVREAYRIIIGGRTSPEPDLEFLDPPTNLLPQSPDAMTVAARFRLQNYGLKKEAEALTENRANIEYLIFESRRQLRQRGRETALNVLEAEAKTQLRKITAHSAKNDRAITAFRLLFEIGRLNVDTIRLVASGDDAQQKSG